MSSKLYFDGSCRPYNPGGYCCYGYVLYVKGKTYSGYGYIGRGTNNQAEYAGVIEGLKKSVKLGVKSLIVRGDSQLVINHLRGNGKVKAPNLFPFFSEAVSLSKEFDEVVFEWVPREKNKKADKLSRMAYVGLSSAMRLETSIKENIISKLNGEKK